METYRWFLSRCCPLVDRSGHILGWYGSDTDIHDRKQAEETLRRSEGYLAEAQRLTHTGSWAYNIGTKELIHSSEEHYRLFGFDPAKECLHSKNSIQRIHPEDRGQAMQEFENLAARQQTLTPISESFIRTAQRNMFTEPVILFSTRPAISLNSSVR